MLIGIMTVPERRLACARLFIWSPSVDTVRFAALSRTTSPNRVRAYRLRWRAALGIATALKALPMTVKLRGARKVVKKGALCMKLRIVGVIPVAALCVLGLKATATHSASVAAKQAQPLPVRVTVDGQTTPDAVPDDIAFSLFFRMIDQGQSPLQRARLQAYINRAFATVERTGETPLSEQNRARQRQRADRLIALIESHRLEIDTVEASRSSAPSDFAMRRAKVVESMRRDLVAKLGEADAAIVERFVTEVVKRRIRGYGR
jgi:hypothetical protein